MAATIKSKDNQVAVEVYIYDSKELYHKVFEHKDEIESKLGLNLDWQELPDRKASRIILTHKGDFNNEQEEAKLIKWLCETADNFAAVFPKYITD